MPMCHFLVVIALNKPFLHIIGRKALGMGVAFSGVVGSIETVNLNRKEK